MRSSQYKNEIFSLFGKSHLLSIAEIRKMVPGADFSTIFRNVEKMCKDGKLRKIVATKDTTLYEKKSLKRHDHFICDCCGLIEALPPIRVPKKYSENVEVILRGQCSPCKKIKNK